MFGDKLKKVLPVLPFLKPMFLSIWAFCLRMREMNGIFEFGAICWNAYALRRVFKWVIYVVRKILSREMKDYNKFTHISNTVDMHFVCRDFG